MSNAPGWLRTMIALAACALALTRVQAGVADYTIDSARTSVSFEVRNLGIYTQRGQFAGAAGTVALDAEAGYGRLDIVIDARSIEAGSMAAERFLRGPSMLNVEQFPSIAYKAERVTFVEGEPYRVDGELTLLGVTRPVTLTVTGYRCVRAGVSAIRRCMLDAVASFRRSEFGMNRYLAITSDDVKLAIRTEGVIDASRATAMSLASSRGGAPLTR